MSEYLSTFTVVALYNYHQEEKHFLTTKSLIKSKTYLTPHATKHFENTLFYIQVDGNNMEFNVPIEYDQPIAFRHMISQKYLTLTVDEQDEKEMKYRLVLGTEKKYFRINPCYQYQTKISTKIKFNEEIYLSTEYTESRQGMVIVQQHQNLMQLFLGFSFGSKLQFHYNSTYEKQQKYYKHGKIVWLSHIQSENFLSLANVNGREEVVFEPIKIQKQVQNMSALWTIEPKELTESNHLMYDQEIRFKNILSGYYLSFSKNYRLVDNQRIYQIFLEENRGDNSRFLFKPIKEKDAKAIDKNSYLSLLHCDSNLYLGCRKEKVNQQCFKLLTFPYSEDQDLFKLHSFNIQEEQALRFIVAIRAEFKEIEKVSKIPVKDVTLAQVLEIQETYLNVKREFTNLKKYEKLFEFVRNELGPSIRIIASSLQFFRSISDVRAPAPASTASRSSKMKTLSNAILSLAYHILCVFCEQHSSNQSISFEYLGNYLVDVGQAVGAEETVIETFRNNKMLLPKAVNQVSKEGNVVRVLLTQFHKKNTEKNDIYWKNLQKIIEVLNALIFHHGTTLDVNQNLISHELFKNGFYERIMLPIRVQGPRIVILDPQTNMITPIENLTNPQVNTVVELLLLLFSNLTQDHSFNSKKYIHSYLSENNQACLSVMIAYLNKPIRRGLYNQLLNFISKTYLDSSPRLKRIKPLPFIFFHFQPQKSHIEQQQGYMSERLKQLMMLRLQQSKICKPLHYSNLLPAQNNSSSSQPSMSEQQLVSFRLNLTEKILNNKNVSEPQLQTISLLMQLECYTTNQMLQLYDQLKRKLLRDETEEILQQQIMGIINEIYLLLMELQTKKLTIYLKYKFMEDKDLPKEEYKYVLPLSSRVFIPAVQKNEIEPVPQQDLLQSSRYQASENLIGDYNELRDTLALMHASPELKRSLVKHFCNFNEERIKGQQAASYLESLFNLILQTHLPKFKFLNLLSKSTVLTHQEVAQFDQLFSTAKKLQYLILISDYWMVSDNEPEIYGQFLRHLSELTNFLYEDFDPKQPEGFHRKMENISTKRQLFMNSLGVHRMVLQLLQKNSYLILQAQTKKDLPKKLKQVFEFCFEFIYCFIKQCSQNKKTIQDFFPVVLLYQNCVQLGQLKVYTQFFRDEKGFVKEVNFAFVENILKRIVKSKDDGKNDFCQYNPEYIELLIVMINSLDIESRLFVDKLYSLIVRPEIYNRLLFLQESKQSKENKFCLKLHKVRLDPLQLPLLYHQSLLSLFNLILSKATESIRNSFKLKLTQTFKIHYIFQILAVPDVFSNMGIAPQLNFILKEQILVFSSIFLEKPELAGEIYQSDQLKELLQFWNRTFLKKQERKEITDESQSFYLPFMNDITDKVINHLNNKSQYYHTFIKPFLEKLIAIFEKQKIDEKVREQSARQYLFSLDESLKDEFKGLSRGRQTTFVHSFGLKDIKLKWRNFVDDDEDNSKEEKYVKKVVLDILKSKQSANFISEQLKSFFEVIQKNSKAFLKSMVRLLRILFASKEITEGRMKQSKTALKVLRYLSEYISFRSLENAAEQENQRTLEMESIIESLQECKFIQIFIDLTSKKEYELRKVHLKHIFYYCLKILNFLLEHDKAQKFSKALFQIFKNNPQSYQFLEFLKQGALEIISTIDPHSHLQQINSALAEMRLCTDGQPIQLHQQAYLTLTYLCKHEPFTYFLRNQQSSFADTDFLDKIYNILIFLFKNNDQRGEFAQSITISSVRAAEYILDFVCSILNGPNGPNQNYLIDNKFTHFVLKVLKLDDLPAREYQFRGQRSQLLQKIIDFYRSNGIQISELLQSRISLYDYRHSYLLNRFKCVLIKCLLQCLVANQNNMVRVKMDIPVQIIKLNFIWVYEAYKKGKYQYRQDIILREREDWNTLIERETEIDPLFLRLGYYYYQLIDLYQEKEGENQSMENEDKIINEEKQKERVVKKFFASIQEKSREKQKEQSLEQEQLREQMKYYYHMYYNAIIFFRKKTGTIEVDLKGDIIKVYFPILPIAEKITPQMEQEFKTEVKRVSRDEKIKSMIQFQNEFYEDLNGEEEYFDEIERRMPFLGPILRMMKYEDQFMLTALIVSFMITVFYLLDNYQAPSFEFSNAFFSYLKVAGRPSRLIILLLSLMNLLIGLLIGVYLFTRKIPLRKKLLSLKFAELQVKAKGKADTPTNETLYIWSNIVKQTAYNLYIVIFLMLTILHPFFSAFPLVEIISRIEMGRFIIRSIKETWPQLLVAVGLLIVFNVIFVQIFYQFYTAATGYGTMCKSQWTCMKLLVDQNLKGGGGVLGNVDSDYVNMVLNTQVIAQIVYILISLKVIAQIFSGTIIDKFSQLRQEEQKIEEDQNKICFICAQQRFDLDLEYEGFTTHTEVNHAPFNYIKYLFYLRRCQPREYGIVERYIHEQRLKEVEIWIPENNSLSKQAKQKGEEEVGEDIKEKVMVFVRDKARDMRRVRQKVEAMVADLRRQNKKMVEPLM